VNRSHPRGPSADEQPAGAPFTLHPGRRLPVTLGALLLAVAPAAMGAVPFHAGPAGRVEIDLPSQVEVTGPAFTLGEVAEVTGGDPQALAALRSVPLGPSPRPSAVLHLSREQVTGWLRSRTGLDPAALAWRGARSATIRSATRELPGEALVARAVQGFEEMASMQGLRAAATARTPPRDVRVPRGEVTLGARPVAPAAALATSTTVLVEVWAGGRVLATVPVVLEVEVTGPAMVSRRALAAGALLEGSSLQRREVRWSGLSSRPIGGEALPGLRLRRPLREGEPVKQEDVEPAPQVSRGAFATVRTLRGMVEVESRAEVLQDGLLGERVQVRPALSSGPVLARVTGPGTVEMEP